MTLDKLSPLWKTTASVAAGLRFRKKQSLRRWQQISVTRHKHSIPRVISGSLLKSVSCFHKPRSWCPRRGAPSWSSGWCLCRVQGRLLWKGCVGRGRPCSAAGSLLPWLGNNKGSQARLIFKHVLFSLLYLIVTRNDPEGKDKIYSKGVQESTPFV